MTLDDIDARRQRIPGLTQKDLCRRANVHPMTYSRNKRPGNYPSGRTLHRLEKALRALEDAEAAS